MIKFGVAVGVGVGAFLLLCCLCWGLWKLRQCIKTGRMLEQVLAERRKGVKKDVVRTFPIVEASELNFEDSTKLQCPICWLEFLDADSIRQLPHCDHVFHRQCIDRVLEHRITCPVCGTILTDHPLQNSEDITSTGKQHKKTVNPPLYQQQIPLRSLYSLNKTTTPESEEDLPPPSSWMLVNQPRSLPHTETEHGSDRFEIELNASRSFGNSGELPLLTKYFSGAEDWHSDDVLQVDQTCIDISFTFGTEVPVETRRPPNPNGEKPTTTGDSFTFTTPSSFLDDAAISAAEFRRSSWRCSRGKDSASFSDLSTRFSQTSSRSSSLDSRFDKSERWDSAREHLEEVAEGEGSISGEHLPLTDPPDHCVFDVLPVATGNFEVQGNSPPKVGTNRTTYFQL